MNAPERPTPELRARVERLRDWYRDDPYSPGGDAVDALTACLAALDAAEAEKARLNALHDELLDGSVEILEVPEAPYCERHGVMVAGDEMGRSWSCPACLDAADTLRAERDRLLEALEVLRSDGGCWCDTGDGNPHTAACRVLTALLTPTLTPEAPRG